MRNNFRKEFEVLCFVVDRTVMTGECPYEETIRKFGDKIIKDFIYNKKIIRKSHKNPGLLELTESGRNYIIS